MTQYGAHVTDIAGVASTAAGGILALANPEGADLIVTRVVLDKTVQSTGAATADIGIAANGSTSSDTLMDGVSLQGAGPVDNISDVGTNGKARQRWNSGQFLTITGSATSVGLVGRLYIEYMRVKP
jgi:hypothetical protein